MIDELLDSEVGEQLKSILGIEPVNAAAIAAEIDDPDRFGDPEKLVANAGIDASKYQPANSVLMLVNAGSSTSPTANGGLGAIWTSRCWKDDYADVQEGHAKSAQLP